MTDDTLSLYDSLKAALKADDSSVLHTVLEDARAADIAEIFELLPDEDRSRIIYTLPAHVTAEVIVMLDEAERGEVVEDMDDVELAELASEMEDDDAADFLGEMSEELREDILEHIPDEQSDRIEELLAYEEDTAGGLMTKELVILPGSATVREAIREIRANQDEHLHYVYVTDEDMILRGIVTIRKLVLNDRETRLDTIWEPDPIAVHVHDDQEKVANVFAKYDIAAVPVIDDQGHLLGKITYDDAFDVIEEEADEDIYRMAGLTTDEFEKTSISRAAWIRLSWLIPCLASMAITAAVLVASKRFFHFSVHTALIAFAPMIGAIGGNCGIQISTVIVRGLATGELASTMFRTAFSRESRIALMMAPACGLIAFLVCYFGLPVMTRMGEVSEDVNVMKIALSVGSGMTVAILVAAGLGMVLPFLFRRIGVDPAIASGPIVTTVNDILSVSIFLALASLIIG